MSTQATISADDTVTKPASTAPPRTQPMYLFKSTLTSREYIQFNNQNPALFFYDKVPPTKKPPLTTPLQGITRDGTQMIRIQTGLLTTKYDLRPPAVFCKKGQEPDPKGRPTCRLTVKLDPSASFSTTDTTITGEPGTDYYNQFMNRCADNQVFDLLDDSFYTPTLEEYPWVTAIWKNAFADRITDDRGRRITNTAGVTALQYAIASRGAEPLLKVDKDTGERTVSFSIPFFTKKPADPSLKETYTLRPEFYQEKVNEHTGKKELVPFGPVFTEDGKPRIRGGTQLRIIYSVSKYIAVGKWGTKLNAEIIIIKNLAGAGPEIRMDDLFSADSASHESTTSGSTGSSVDTELEKAMLSVNTGVTADGKRQSDEPDNPTKRTKISSDS